VPYSTLRRYVAGVGQKRGVRPGRVSARSARPLQRGPSKVGCSALLVLLLVQNYCYLSSSVSFFQITRGYRSGTEGRIGARCASSE
jgi:hypothetical protein